MKRLIEKESELFEGQTVIKALKKSFYIYSSFQIKLV